MNHDKRLSHPSISAGYFTALDAARQFSGADAGWHCRRHFVVSNPQFFESRAGVAQEVQDGLEKQLKTSRLGSLSFRPR